MKKKLLALFLCCALSFGLVTAALITPAAADEDFLVYGSDGLVAHTVELAKNNKLALTAVASTGSGVYQWQIQVGGDVWANISGANGVTLDVSYALVANLLYGGAANLRCRLTAGEVVKYTNTVTVQITDETPVSAPAQAPKAPTVISEAEPVGEPTIIPPQTVEEIPAPDAAPAADAAPANDLTANVAPAALTDPAPVNDPAPSDNGEDEDDDKVLPATYTILINYQFADGKQAANPWSATVAAGSTYTQTITSPVVVGYTPDQAAVEVNASEATTYTVTYHPAEVEFTVKHYQQNVTGAEYTLAETETKTGYTGSPVGADLAKSYDGFYKLIYATDTAIAADGSTEVEIYYDRYYYLMKLNLDGGYGLEPIYARYGTPITIGEPTKPGYSFNKWEPALPTTMPVNGGEYKALWNLGEAGFNVIFWYENPNPNEDGSYGYSVVGTFKPSNVKPGTEKKSGDYKDQSFEGRDDKHFTYNAAKAETVTVNGDGSTVLNVYYTRNTYTLTFKNGQVTQTCTKTEHTHTHDQCCTKTGWHVYCNSKKCPVGYEHTHSSKCYKYSDLTITAKYGADIHGNFPIKEGNNTLWWKVPKNSQYFKPDTQLGSIDTMPGESITFTRASADYGAVLWYYIETLNGESGEYTHDGKNFKLYKKIDIEQSGVLTYSEEFHDITGFTQWWSDPAFDKMALGGETNGIKENNYLCYTRNSYNLTFFNYNAKVKGQGGSVQYEAPLKSYNFEPSYPAELEPNAFVFAGWYTTVDCLEGTKVNFDTMTMPASDVILYAKWTTATHTVKTFLTEDVVNKENPLNTWEKVPHNTTVTAPEEPERGAYKFVGWFYRTENGDEKAFDFQMPVHRDLDLYAAWSSDSLMPYTIKYAVRNKDDTLTYIADDTVGSALAGTTKTFDAKTGTQLKEGYQAGYFPETGSHSITFNIEGGNDYTFIYVPKPEVEYTVKYLEKGTENPLAAPQTFTTRDAVVTETFKQITGYAPDAYQKQLVLAAEGNEIIFWYIKDDAHAPVQTIHWVQNIKGEGYAEYQKSTNLNGVIGTEYPETPLTIPGFEYNSNPQHPVDGYPAQASGTLTEAGPVLNLYYDRILYPYEFRFVEKDSSPEKTLADSVTDYARYQAQVTQTAKAIPGYTLVSAENQAINIAIEDPANVASKNVKTFYYVEQTVEIKYVVSGPEGCGTLDNYQESQLKVTTGTVKGAVPTAADGFKFVGWYTDEACTQPVIATWVMNNKITPEKTKNLGNNVKGYEAATYYAKFEADVANLTITKQGYEEIDGKQSFIFTVTGPEGFSKKIVIQGNGTVVLTGLKIGTYTVTEDTAWSWRYTPRGGAEQTITLQAGKTNSVTYVNDRTNNKWLDGNAYCKNVFGTVIETDSGN